MLEILVWGLVSLAPAAEPPPWVPPKIPVAEDRFGPWIMAAPPAQAGVVPAGLFPQPEEQSHSKPADAPPSPEFTVPMGVLPAFYGKPVEPPDPKKEDAPAPLEFTVPALRPTPVAEEEEVAEEEAAAGGGRGLLMRALQSTWPGMLLDDHGTQVYGWFWGGFTSNFASPSDRINFGTNYNWKSNDFRLDQVYFVLENTLEHENNPNIGYRVDFYAGHQAPFMVSLGLFSDFTGFDTTSGYGVDGPASFRQLNRIGIDLPQFYVNAHIPHVITERGMDVLVGKFWTLLGHEVYPGPLTEFYSHSYEIVYGTPFNHTGGLATVHATANWDVTAGVVVGSDVFRDNNQSPSFTGNFIWNSNDKRWNWNTAWITGPEQPDNNENYRTVITSYVIGKLGSREQWMIIFGGNVGREANAAPDSLTGDIKDAEWHGLSGYLFYTVNPKLILGSRIEWFRDDDGVRTAVTKRPGFAANFYEVTLGATYKPCQSLRVRPEIRFDWSNGPAIDGSTARPYNDLRDGFQSTAAIDVIWSF